MLSNVEKGALFAKCVEDHLRTLGHSVEPEYEVAIGVNSAQKKVRKFDLGNESLVVECKAYDWTAGGNIPSAKLTTVNEAMLYFLGTPRSFRKMLFLAATERRSAGRSETLAEYYVRTYGHLIPEDVEIYELDCERFQSRRIELNVYEPERNSVFSRPVPLPSDVGWGKDVAPVFPLRLSKTYYNQGFFNVPVAFDHLVDGDGPVTLALGTTGSFQGSINRTANLNGTPRIMGRVRLRDWFQRNYSVGDTVPVRFESPRRMALG